MLRQESVLAPNAFLEVMPTKVITDRVDMVATPIAPAGDMPCAPIVPCAPTLAAPNWTVEVMPGTAKELVAVTAGVPIPTVLAVAAGETDTLPALTTRAPNWSVGMIPLARSKPPAATTGKPNALTF
jgi:hypothetical protein